MECRPVEDDAKRTIVAWDVLIDVEAHVTSGASGADRADATLTLMQQQLMTKGLELHYDSKGFGTTFTVNKADGTGVRDVAWGPTPKLLNFQSLGENNAALVHWTVLTRVPFCPAAATYAGRPMAVNYEVEFGIDQDQYTTMTVSGYLEIPMTYPTGGATNLPDNADAYREQITPQIPPGFKPVNKTFRVSPDKRRLDFSFSFQELPKNGLPIGCTSATGRHTLRSDGRNTDAWYGTISASYVVSPNRPKSDAWLRFLTLLKSRLLVAKSKQKSIAFFGLSISEGLYEDGRSSSFEMQYRLTCKLQDLLQISGLWKPVPGTDYQSWAASVSDILGPRGKAGLRNLPSDDAIINLCGGNVSVMKSGGSISTLTAQAPQVPCPSFIDPATSWLRFRNSIDPEAESNSIRHKSLNPVTLTNVQPVEDGPSFLALQFQPDLIQQRTTPSFGVVMRGYALRLGYTIPIPYLSNVGGVPTVLIDYRTPQHVVGFLGCVPVVRADWYFRYMVPQPPQGVIFPSQNPEMTSFDPSFVVKFSNLTKGQSVMRTVPGADLGT